MAQVQRKRMLWWYSSIIDWMIANPGKTLTECAKHHNRSISTISVIVNSDAFKAALAQRKAQFQQTHDLGIIQKTTQIAHASLDSILDTLNTKKDKVPLPDLTKLADTALARLGYGVPQAPQSPGVTVNVQNNTVALPVSASDLEEARMALRTAQASRQRAVESTQPPPLIEGTAELKEEDGVYAPIASSN